MTRGELIERIKANAKVLRYPSEEELLKEIGEYLGGGIRVWDDMSREHLEVIDKKLEASAAPHKGNA